MRQNSTASMRHSADPLSCLQPSPSPEPASQRGANSDSGPQWPESSHKPRLKESHP